MTVATKTAGEIVGEAWAADTLNREGLARIAQCFQSIDLNNLPSLVAAGAFGKAFHGDNAALEWARIIANDESLTWNDARDFWTSGTFAGFDDPDQIASDGDMLQDFVFTAVYAWHDQN